ncbi:helical hairpin domain-containing protein [Lactococcus lactis]|uniref:helical hairpin domain-containing protein n=1 Tax=Lactococcus lactis TaxID=1358 RepID=UPI0035E13963
MDRLENGDYQVYLKKKDFFHFMNQKDTARSRYIDGETLVRQLSLYNGTTPLKKEPIISTINEIVDAINFLAEHGVTEGSQLKHMEASLYDALDEAQIKLDKIDEKILELTQIAKYLIAETSEDPEEVHEAKTALDNMNVNSDLKYRDIQQELSSEKLGRKILKNKFDQTVSEINQVNEIEATKTQEIKEKGQNKII